MRVAKHEKQVDCPWFEAGAIITFADENGEYYMARKEDLATGRPMPR